jgi:hypothetical protein
METAEHGFGNDASAVGKLVTVLRPFGGKAVGWLGNAGPKGRMRPSAVVEVFELEKNPADVVLGKRDQEIETLAT